MAAGAVQLGVTHQLGPRVPVKARAAFEEATQVIGSRIPSRVFGRSSSTSTKCVSNNDADNNLCETSVSASTQTLAIVLGIVIPLTVIAIVLVILHRRNAKRVRQEDALDQQKSLDYGLAMDNQQATNGKHKKRKSLFFGTPGEKDGIQHPRQLSMDMNLSSPYLLPPDLRESRESLHSLARTLHQSDDPYRPVTEYTNSEVGSLRSFQKDGRDHSSLYTTTSRFDESRRSAMSTGVFTPPPQHALPAHDNGSPQSKSSVPPPYPELSSTPAPESPIQPPELSATPAPSAMPAVPPPTKAPFGLDFKLPELDNAPTTASPTSPTDNSTAAAEIDAQVPVPSKIARKGLPSSPRPQPQGAAPTSNHRSVSEAGTDEPFIYDMPGAGLQKDAVDGNANGMPTPNGANSLPGESFPPRQSSASMGQALAQAPAIVAPIVEEPHNYPDEYQDESGRAAHRRQSSEYPQEEDANALQSGLNAPQFDTRRLSVGFRPLPPDEIIDSEDPETRANRIRSFYKEYFDDSKGVDMSNYPPQGIPNKFRGPPNRGGGGGQYYEDYDQSYLGDSAAYFDPESNSFVMPYAQPVSRRAMTPPPSGSRRPRGGPPRNFHGSMGGASMFQQGPRPGSSVSNRMGQRSASNMSGRFGPRKPMPPPADLKTLPTPHMLKDDSAIFQAIEFAPPVSLAELTAGRSQSPLGERRPYSPKLPVSSPLVSSFDEMLALPSPHLLRKSGTFTSLDFAPPRKFKDPETMSDAGSIRSNRSGISAMQQAAIRSGAGRVSRLPGDQVFTRAAMDEQLKPSWTMRP